MGLRGVRQGLLDLDLTRYILSPPSYSVRIASLVTRFVDDLHHQPEKTWPRMVNFYCSVEGAEIRASHSYQDFRRIMWDVQAKQAKEILK